MAIVRNVGSYASEPATEDGVTAIAVCGVKHPIRAKYLLEEAS